MISTQFAIDKTRRDMALGALLRWGLIVAGIFALLLQPLDSASNFAMGLLFGVGAIWLILGFRSIRGTRLAADSSSLIAAGQFDLAEQQIASALDAFSIFRMSKLLCLHDLAMLRHAQNRWQESALLCRALLTQRGGVGGGLDRSSRLILAESLLELGDLGGAHHNLTKLYSQRLSLRQALHLLYVQLDYSTRIGAWDSILMQLPGRVEMAELLPTHQAARMQAFLALAAKKTGRADWWNWLRRRVELLADIKQLCTDRPMLREVWE